jgi:T4 beta protein
MSGFDDKHYVPFLKGKAGEIKALGQLDTDERDALTPLIEVPPQKVTFSKAGAKIETVDKTLKGYAARLSKAWGSVDHCYVDIAQFDPDVRLRDGRHPLTAFFADAKKANLAAIPVTGLDRDSAQLEAVETVCKTWRVGVAVRLRRPELRDTKRLVEVLPRFLRLLDQEPGQIDLLLDFGELISSEVKAIETEARAAILALPDLKAWRSLVLCTGAFPAEVSSFIRTRASGERPRRDWALWQRLFASAESLPRLPAFADYGVTGAEWGPPFNPRKMNPACKIVYATDEEWVIVRGRSFRDFGGEQYRQLAAQIKAREEFLGVNHCSADKKIVDCAAGLGGTGNLEQWVTAATRHHIEVVSRQLASPPALVAAS